MAGIGFELKKLFAGHGIIKKMRAYTYASIISAGTMMLTFVLLILVQRLADVFGAVRSDLESLIVMMVYAMGGSLILSSGMQLLLSRFVADQVFLESYERIIPSLFGGSLMLIIPGGIAFGLLLSTAHELPVLDRVLNWCLFIVLIPVWLQMSYITSVKDYQRILLGFGAGLLTTALLTWLLLSSGVHIRTAVLFSLFCGYGVMMSLYMRVLMRYFPPGKGSIFYFTAWIGKYPDYLVTGFCLLAGAYVHMIAMWFSPLGDSIYRVFLHSGAHDSAVFYAFLVAVPSSVNFVVSVEVTFYEKYKQYFSAVSDGGTLSAINIARSQMSSTLRQEVYKLSMIQAFFMVLYAVIMRYYLITIGFTHDMVSMFQVMVVGYSAYAVGNCLVQLLLYFNDRKGALALATGFFCTNLVISLLTIHGPSLFYDLGLFAGGGVLYIGGVLRLFSYVDKIDYHVFCEEPLLQKDKLGMWHRFSEKFDHHAMERVEPKPEGEETQDDNNANETPA